jgi:hypothetical protein
MIMIVVLGVVAMVVVGKEKASYEYMIESKERSLIRWLMVLVSEKRTV